jgi:hypothetical protein
MLGTDTRSAAAGETPSVLKVALALSVAALAAALAAAFGSR